MKIALTGTPGTGKTSLGKKLAHQMGIPFLDTKRIILRERLYRVNKSEKEKTVSLEKLEKSLREKLKKKKDGVLESHLLCEFTLPIDVIVVLRCDPNVLESRLKKRRYPASKIRDNLLCEALDYVTQKAEGNYPKARILEVDTTTKITAGKLALKIQSKKSDRVNWSSWLEQNV